MASEEANGDSTGIVIRPAGSVDAPLVLAVIWELAEYDGEPEGFALWF